MATFAKGVEIALIGVVSACFGGFVLYAMPPGTGKLHLVLCFSGVTLMTATAIGSTFMKD